VYRDVLRDPALPPAGAMIPCGMRSDRAEVPRHLIAALQGHVLLTPLCVPVPDTEFKLDLSIDTLRPHGGGLNCAGGFARLPSNDQGLVSCSVVEILPASGPINHCAQLATHGRDATPVDVQNGLEFCQTQQLPYADDTFPTGQGFVFATTTHDSATQAGWKSACLLDTAQDDVGRFWVPRDFHFIAGSFITQHCVTVDSDTCQ
jgi:hypothetical protein